LDAATLLNQAITLKLEDTVGGYDYINALFEKSIDPANIGFYLTRMLDASTKLRVLLAAEDIIDLAEKNRTLTGEGLDANTLVAGAQEKFLKIALENLRGDDPENLADGLDELLAEAVANPSRVRGLSTGLVSLDEAVNGLEPGTLTVVGARPKVGKSTLLLNWAAHIAYDCQTPILLIDTEMRKPEQQFRLVSILSRVPEKEIKNGTYDEDSQKVDRVRQARDIINSGLILHKYYPDFTAEGVAAMTRKFHHQGAIGCLFFDYIKLPDSDLQLMGRVKEHQALGYLCVALKNLAGQLNIPVVTAAQIGRVGSQGRVTSSDFADSDRILRYANTLLGLSVKTGKELAKLEEEYGRERRRDAGSHRLQILDTRAGGTNPGGIDIHFRKEILFMEEAREQLSSFRAESEEDEHGSE
jgi:replicative DNA helicase